MNKADHESFRISSRVVDASLFEPVPNRRFEAVREKDYIQQIAEYQGIHSCFPTSILNGWVSVDAITTDEAQSVQTTLVSEKKDWFGDVTLGGEAMQTFAVSPYRLEDLTEEVTGKRIRLEVMQTQFLKNVREYVRYILQYNALVGGDISHAVLAAAISQDGEKIAVIDPRFPEVIQDWEMQRYVSFVTTDSGELTIIKPSRILQK